MTHKCSPIILADGSEVTAAAPVTISASRATDIPAFYCKWFFQKLAQGYTVWRNPFNGKDCYVSFQNTKFIVFWSKNPAPLIEYIPYLQQRDIGCYVQFTLNDYQTEGFEPNLPILARRIDTFKRLVDILGVGSVIWRFDPLVLSDRVSIDSLIEKIRHIGNLLNGYTEKLVFSFADIGTYRKVGKNMYDAGINYTEWTEKLMREFAEKLTVLNAGQWDYTLATCSESISLEEYGIEHNRCIDPDLISRLRPSMQPMMFNANKDKGQRSACGCILAKDIGSYNTCPHGCLYCYANTSPHTAKLNFASHNPNNLSII